MELLPSSAGEPLLVMLEALKNAALRPGPRTLGFRGKLDQVAVSRHLLKVYYFIRAQIEKDVTFQLFWHLSERISAVSSYRQGEADTP
jgi:hypothetical protein